MMAGASQDRERRLEWDACYNVRDLGGYAAGDGRRTRWRAVLRGDNLCRLTPAGRAALLDAGVRTIVDLRSPSEVATFPHPFGDSSARDLPLPITYLNLPLLDEADDVGAVALRVAETVREQYVLMLDRYAVRMAAVLEAIASAPQDAVLAHCHAGKDRTGLVAALLLELAGVPRPTIAEDYALSDSYLQPLYAQLLTAAHDDAARERLRRLLVSSRETMLSVLSYLDDRYGGPRAYLQAAGVTAGQFAHLRERLLAPSLPVASGQSSVND